MDRSGGCARAAVESDHVPPQSSGPLRVENNPARRALLIKVVPEVQKRDTDPNAWV